MKSSLLSRTYFYLHLNQALRRKRFVQIRIFWFSIQMLIFFFLFLVWKDKIITETENIFPSLSYQMNFIQTFIANRKKKIITNIIINQEMCAVRNNNKNKNILETNINVVNVVYTMKFKRIFMYMLMYFIRKRKKIVKKNNWWTWTNVVENAVPSNWNRSFYQFQ